MTREQLGGGIVRTQIADPAVTAAVLAAAELATAWRAAEINAGLDVDRSIRDADVLHEAADPALIATCRDRLFTATRAIAAEAAPKTVLAEIQIVRYHAGGRYVDHRDSPAPGATPRALSLVWYLNDGFTGGATIFPECGISVQPRSGDIVVFAPEMLHRAAPVISGIKFAVTAWYHVPPRRA